MCMCVLMRTCTLSEWTSVIYERAREKERERERSERERERSERSERERQREREREKNFVGIRSLLYSGGWQRVGREWEC